MRICPETDFLRSTFRFVHLSGDARPLLIGEVIASLIAVELDFGRDPSIPLRTLADDLARLTRGEPGEIIYPVCLVSVGRSGNDCELLGV